MLDKIQQYMSNKWIMSMLFVGENIIKKYSVQLQEEVGKKYNERTLRRYRQFYLRFNNIKWSQVATELSWSHYSELISIDDDLKVKYYINQCITLKLSRNELRNKIKQQEYERLSEYAKQKISSQLSTEDKIAYAKKNSVKYYVLENTGSIDDLYQKIKKYLNEI